MCCVLTPGRFGVFRPPEGTILLGWGGFKVCEEVWMCLWKDSILLVLIKPFLSRIPPCSVLFLQLPGLEWELQPLSCPTGIFSLIPPLPQNPGGIRHVPGSLIRTPGCCRALLPLPFPPGASGTSQQISRFKKSRFFFWKEVPTLALLSLTQPGPFPWETQTLCG